MSPMHRKRAGEQESVGSREEGGFNSAHVPPGERQEFTAV